MRQISENLKRQAVAAFRDNAKLALISDEDREKAARFYDDVAEETRQVYALLARRYNLNERDFFEEK